MRFMKRLGLPFAVATLSACGTDFTTGSAAGQV